MRRIETSEAKNRAVFRPSVSTNLKRAKTSETFQHVVGWSSFGWWEATSSKQVKERPRSVTSDLTLQAMSMCFPLIRWVGELVDIDLVQAGLTPESRRKRWLDFRRTSSHPLDVTKCPLPFFLSVSFCVSCSFPSSSSLSLSVSRLFQSPVSLHFLCLLFSLFGPSRSLFLPFLFHFFTCARHACLFFGKPVLSPPNCHRALSLSSSTSAPMHL